MSGDSIEIEESEFGRGYSYCLGLFLAHAERLESTLDTYKKMRQEPNTPEGLFADESAVSIWFNGAGDHLFEFEAKTEREIKFKHKILGWRLISRPTLRDAYWAIKEAKALLLEFDLKHGIAAMKAEYE